MSLDQMRTHEPLADKTTLGVGGPARAYLEVDSAEALGAALRWAQAHEWPVFVLGDGSNLVVHDDGVAALVVRLTGQAVQFSDGPDGTVRVSAEAGLSWDALVQAACARGLWGIECLSGIPGRVGAAPVQNIGAYGQEVAASLVEIEVMPLHGGPPERWPAAALALGYRHSCLRAQPGRYAVTRVQLRLHRRPTEAVRVPVASGVAHPEAVRAAVLATRAAKGMLWHGGPTQLGNVGSFFVNPVVSAAHADALSARFADMPRFAAATGVKLAAGWLIEQAGLAKGHRFAETQGRVGLSVRHALSLCNMGGARAADVLQAARVVAAHVQRAFGVALMPEARFVGYWPEAPEHAQAWPPPYS